MREARGHLDFETRSTVDLRRSGVYRYAEHPTTSAWCFSWSTPFDEGEWEPGDEDPLPFLQWVEEGGVVVAHNAAFERVIWNHVIRRDNPHWPEMRVEQQDCTMARGLALGLPAGLESLGFALETPMQKDKDGHALMLRMCRPRRMDPITETRSCDDLSAKCKRCKGAGSYRVKVGEAPVWWDDEERRQRLKDYCKQDRLTETDVDASIPLLSPEERRVWELDQRINDRGVMIDVASVEAALSVVTEALKRADERMWWLTDGEVRKCSETAKIVAWFNARGIPTESIAKGEVEEIVLKASIMGDATAEEVIRLRRAAAKTSTAKLKAMLNSVCSDGRVRGTLAYHGAATGRWAGRLVQPQNILRFDADDLPDILLILDLLALPQSASERTDAIEMMVGPPLESVAKCLRAMFVAAPGKKFVSGDFSNIEGRGAAWIAGEQWKLDAFRAFDRGEGEDLYKISYSRSFGVPVGEVTKAQRQIGKVQELALGYQGSVGAYINMAANYGIKPEQVAEVAREAIPVDTWLMTSERYGDTNSHGLDRDTWTGIKCVVDAWRAAHPNIVQAWWDLQDAAIAAVYQPGLKVPVLDGRIMYLAANGFLYCRLPSGRVVSYAKPRVIKTHTDTGRERLTVEYWAVNSYTKRWEKARLYGGLQFNNCVQGLARDKLVASMFRLEEAGYPLVLTVHDENVSEVDEAFGSWQEYRDIMAQADAWCADMPVAVGAWEDRRYVK